MKKPKPAKTDDLSVLLTFPDSATGEAVIAELTQRRRDSESAFAMHKESYSDAALMGDDELVTHMAATEVFERTSARLSVALEHARNRQASMKQTERQHAGEKARTEALALAQECGSLSLELLGQAKDIAAKLARWNTRCEEVNRLNEIASAGGAESVAMPELPDDAEAAADAGAETAQEFGKFLKDQSHGVWARKQRAQRAAEAEAKRQAEALTEEEAKMLRSNGFNPDILSREPRDADEGYRQGLVQQEIRGIRGQGRGAPAPTTRI